MSKPLAPFSCSYTPNFPELLHALNCAIALSTYQANKVVFLSAPTPEKMVQLPRTFNKAMGISVRDDKLAVATIDELVILKNTPSLALKYPNQPNTYDSLFVPRTSYHTGQLDLHDVEWGAAGLWAVNTRFSCLSLITDAYSFEPQWKPHFISKLLPEDRCHLNGMAMANGAPKYVSALGQGDVAGSWRENKTGGGVIMDVDSNEIVVSGLGMPHTPRIYNGQLYCLLSATGELIKIDVEKGSYEVVNQFNGFVRGMCLVGDHLFIGLSKLRTTSSAFRDLPIAKKSLFCGVMVLHLPTGSIVAKLQYHNSVEELYDVQMIPNTRRPGIVSPAQEVHRRAVVTPETSFWAVASKDN